MTQLNTPQQGHGQGPIAIYELIPVSDITTAQGGHNLLTLTIGGMTSILLDGATCEADLLVQVFLQDSPVGQPLVFMMPSGSRLPIKLSSPIDFIVLSNTSGTFPLPLGFNALLAPYRLPSTTAGYLLITGMDSDFDVAASKGNEGGNQVPLLSIPSTPGGAQAYTFDVDPSITAIDIYLSPGPGGIELLDVNGVQSQAAYYKSNSGVLGGLTSGGGVYMLSFPVMGSLDTSLQVLYQDSGIGGNGLWIMGRRDASAVYTIADDLSPLTIQPASNAIFPIVPHSDVPIPVYSPSGSTLTVVTGASPLGVMQEQQNEIGQTLCTNQTANGLGTAASMSGLNGVQMVEIGKTGTGTCTFSLSGFWSGRPSQHVVGFARVDSQAQLQRVTSLAIPAGSFGAVLQVLDYYFWLNSSVSAVSGSVSLSAWVNGVPV